MHQLHPTFTVSGFLHFQHRQSPVCSKAPLRLPKYRFNLLTGYLRQQSRKGHYSTKAASNNPNMAWLWTFGTVPELEAPEVQRVSEALLQMTPEERGAATSPRIIDVRTGAEFFNGHIPGAVNASFLPPWSFATNIQPQLQGTNFDTPIICICLSAHRSIGALKWLKQQGYTNVTQLAKGMQDWRARGLPEVKAST